MRVKPQVVRKSALLALHQIVSRLHPQKSRLSQLALGSSINGSILVDG